jgi:hypothetical protein
MSRIVIVILIYHRQIQHLRRSSPFWSHNIL